MSEGVGETIVGIKHGKDEEASYSLSEKQSPTRPR